MSLSATSAEGATDPQRARAVTGATADGEYSHAQILRVLTGLLAALFTAMLSSTIVATALPTIMSDLHGTQRQYTWVITISLLAMTVTTPIWGKLADLFSKKLLVQLSIVLFVAGSVGGGLAHSVSSLMAARAVQGIAMGGLTALVQAIIGTMIAPRQRGRYSGYMGAVMAVATVSGPLLGGVITDAYGWRWCFYVCVPLAVVALSLLQATLHLPTLRRTVRIDYLGAVLLAIAAALPMLWVTFAGADYPWVSWQSVAFLAAFLIAAALAVLVELRVAEPVVPIRVLRNRTATLMIIAGVAVGVAMFSASTFMTQYFQLADGNSPTKAGMMTIPLICAQLVSSVFGGLLVTRTGRYKQLMLAGAVAMVVGMAGLGFLNHTTPYWQVAVWMAVMGLGIGALLQNIVLAVQNQVDVKDIGAASATISFFRSLGGALGVAALGAVLADQVQTKIVAGISALGPQAAHAAQGGGADLDIADLPAPIQHVIHHAYGDTFGLIFAAAAVVGLFALGCVIALREIPLRTTVSMKATPSEGEATSPAAGAAGVAQLRDDGDDTRRQPVGAAVRA
ncbi:MAG TPA: MDR family MFS transporter [Segeticoccus sp.]|uniref:MDR family MFS transporter n=1 Tax=Segeticoccus sp. TaxID=2706531 RepID=UPI002D7F8CEC|nr:MDR family MFS transporter [Segeticoccus sp.]HET8601818.1 MDR family MFS transporter [Segeticoccus sp.]